MVALVWDDVDTRRFETGLDRGVLYPVGGVAVPWVGLVSVDEALAGGEVETLWFDGIGYMDRMANEDWKATLQAYTYPDEFEVCDGSIEVAPGMTATMQPRVPFGLSYRTKLGDASSGLNLGYNLHLVYDVTASPSSRSYSTRAGVITPAPFQWELNAVPSPSDSYKPTSHLVVDSTLVDPAVLMDIEHFLYGGNSYNPVMPSQMDIIHVLSNYITEPLSEPV